MRRTKESDEIDKLDEIIAEIIRVLEKNEKKYRRTPSLFSCKAMGLINVKVPAIDGVTSRTPPTLQAGRASGQACPTTHSPGGSGRLRLKTASAGDLSQSFLTDAGSYPGKNSAILRDKYGDIMEKTTKEEFEDRLAQIVARGADVTADAWMREIEVEDGRVPLIFKRMENDLRYDFPSSLQGHGCSNQPSRSKICRYDQFSSWSSTKMSTLNRISHAGCTQNGCEQGRDPGSDTPCRDDFQFISAGELLPYL